MSEPDGIGGSASSEPDGISKAPFRNAFSLGKVNAKKVGMRPIVTKAKFVKVRVTAETPLTAATDITERGASKQIRGF